MKTICATLIIACLNCFNSFGAMPVNLWLQFATGANGSNASTAAYFTASAVSDGNGSWSMNTESQVTFTNVTESLVFPRTLQIGANLYRDSTANFGMYVNLKSNLSSAIYTFNTQPSQVLVTMQLHFGAYRGGANVYDIMDINNSSRALIPQYSEQISSGTWCIKAHNANGVGNGFFNFDLSKWYWLVMYLDNAHNIGTVSLIDASTGKLALDGFGHPCTDTIFEPTSVSTYVSIGRGDTHNDTSGGFDHGAPNVSDPLEIKNYTCSTGVNADLGWSYFEPVILNIKGASIVNVKQP